MLSNNEQTNITDMVEVETIINSTQNFAIENDSDKQLLGNVLFAEEVGVALLITQNEFETKSVENTTNTTHIITFIANTVTDVPVPATMSDVMSSPCPDASVNMNKTGDLIMFMKILMMVVVVM